MANKKIFPLMVPDPLVIQITIVTALFSVNATLVRLVSANSYTIGVFRIVVSSLIMGFFLRKELKKIKANQWLWLSLIGFVFGIHWLTYFLSIKTASASIGIIGTATYGIHLTIFGIIFEKEKPTLIEIIAILTAFFGVLIVVPDFSLSNKTTLGLLIGVCSGASFALLPIIHKKASEIPVKIRAFGQFFFAMLFFLFFIPKTNWDLKSFDWIILLTLAIPCTIAAHGLWANVTTIVKPITASLLYYLSPPLAIIVAAVVLNESLATKQLVGASLVFIGATVGLVSRAKER